MFTNPIEIVTFIFGLLGSTTTIFCFVPQAIKTLFTKDTSGLSKWFFIIAIASSVFWISQGAMLFYTSIVIQNNWINGIIAGVPILLTNVTTIVINIGILVIKLMNIKSAKKADLTEQEYCLELAKKKNRK